MLLTERRIATIQFIFQNLLLTILSISLIDCWSFSLFAQTATQEATVVPSRESIAESSLSTIVFSTPGASIASWTPADPESIVGRVVDFNAFNIVYHSSPDGVLRTRPSSDVAKISFQWLSEEGTAAQVAFESGEYAEVIRLGKLAIAGGKLSSWQQRLLVAKMVDAFWLFNQRVIAGKLFLSLIKDSSPLLVYASAPLIWQPAKIDSAMTEAAMGWMKDSESVDAQLLGASWLLGTSNSAEAIETLQKISRQSNVQLARLATAQQWRVATPKEVANKFLEWRAVRDLLPVALQLGPTLIIAEKLERASLQPEALQEYIRIIAVEPPKSQGSDFAKQRAAEILRSANRSEEATKLLTSPLLTSP